MKRHFLLLLMLFSVCAFAQTDSSDVDEEGDDDGPVEWLKGNMNETHKYGIRFGLSTSSMLGGELDNPRPLVGLNGAAYYRYLYTPKAAVQVEAGISMRGSNFSNSTGQYSAIRLYCIDVPVLWVRALNEKRTSHLLLGAQYSYLFNPEIYIKPNKIAEANRPKLKDYDIMAVAGTQFYAGFVGFQLMAKYGFMNINNGLIPGLNPAFKNKDIHNVTIEINFLF
jgi:hypothetical protein